MQVLWLLIALGVGVATAAPTFDIRLPQQQMLAWEQVYAQAEGEHWLIEWLPKGQSLDDWQRMLTIEIEPYDYVHLAPLSARTLAMRRISDILSKCPQAKITLSEDDDKKMVYWCSTQGCDDVLEANQHKLVTIFQGQHGFNLISLKQRGRYLSERDVSELWQLSQSAWLQEPKQERII